MVFCEGMFGIHVINSSQQKEHPYFNQILLSLRASKVQKIGGSNEFGIQIKLTKSCDLWLYRICLLFNIIWLFL